MKKFNLLFMIFFAAAALSGCRDYYPSNAPRQTATNKAPVLTTVTSSETSRPETYSEYISSLREMESSIREEASHTIGGMQRDTAVSWEQTDTAETMERVTAVTTETSMSSETSVTTVPKDEEDPAETTATCTKNSETSVTTTVFDLSDIPSVPSDRVQADTALTDSAEP